MQILLTLAAVVASVKPLGAFMARVYEGEPTFLDKRSRLARAPHLSALRGPARPRGARDEVDDVLRAMLLFNGIGILAVYAIQRLQGSLPLNPHGIGAAPDLAWNTAVSFATNTNWQNYGGETTMSYFTQMTALAVQNFVCAASGMAVMVALVRGIARKTSQRRSVTSGSTSPAARSTSCLPLSIVFAVALRFAGRRADVRGTTSPSRCFRPRRTRTVTR